MTHARDIAIGVALGVLLLAVTQYTVGSLSAVAVGDSYIQWISSHDSIRLGMMAWFLVVIGLPGLVIPSFIVVCAAVRGLRTQWVWTCGTVLAIYVGKFFFDTLRAVYDNPGAIELNGYSFLVPSPLLPLGVVAGGLVGSWWLKRNSH